MRNIYLHAILLIVYDFAFNITLAADPITITAKSFFVDQTNGIDTNPGSQDQPFKTITKALNSDEACANIYVSGGIYNKDNGEAFPLDLPYGTTLYYRNNNSKPVTINGHGLSEKTDGKDAAIILNGNNRLENLEIDSNNNIGVLNYSGANGILNSKLVNNSVGVGSIYDSIFLSSGNIFSNNTNAALEVSSDSKIILLNNKINNNNVGIIISNNGNLSFKYNNLYGNNTIQENTDCDLFYNGNENLYLDEITWDDDPFNFNISNECQDGNNIANKGFGSIHYQYIPSQNQLLFNADKKINLLSPGFGETIYSQTPTLTYNADSNKLVMIAIWSHPPKVVDNIITNPLDIVWYWHSGMRNSPLGIVNYDNGRKPISGDLNQSKLTDETIPTPLEKGKAYYWSVWEWDDSGTKISGSSITSYFKVYENTASLKNILENYQPSNKTLDLTSSISSRVASKSDYVCKSFVPETSTGGGGSFSIFPLIFYIMIYFSKNLQNNRRSLIHFKTTGGEIT